MGLDSKLELFTTLFGWLFYNTVWDVLTATGIVFLPFIALIVETVTSAYANAEGEEAGTNTLRVFEVEFFIAFFVITLAAVPAIPLSASELSYTPRAVIGTPSEPASTPDNSQSTYGGSLSFSDYPDTVDLPVFWYIVLGFSSGFNRAVIEDVPAALNLREYTQDLRELRISDPALQAEINDFFRDCYIAARSKYLRERPQSDAIDELLGYYGQADTEWIGSHVFLETPGYYNTLRSTIIRTGFLYSSLRDLEWEVAFPPVYGKPFCTEWWTDPTHGLAQKILAQTNGIELVAAAVEHDWDGTKRRDGILRAVMLNSPPRWTSRGFDHAYNNFTQLQSGENGYWAILQNRLQQALAGFGLATESLSFAAYVRIFLEAAPMLQALVLMGLYALLPFFIVISRYRFSVFAQGALILFIVKFWTVLWFFAWWVDQNLIAAFYPEPGDITDFFNTDMTIKRVVLNFLTGLMYLVFPILFTTYLGFAGVGAARGLDVAASTFVGKLAGASRINLSVGKLAQMAKGRMKGIRK